MIMENFKNLFTWIGVIVLIILLIVSIWGGSKITQKQREIWKQLEIENVQYKNKIDSLETINKEISTKILSFEKEIVQLETNLTKSEIDKRRLQSDLNNFKASIDLSQGVEILKINLKNEKDTN